MKRRRMEAEIARLSAEAARLRRERDFLASALARATWEREVLDGEVGRELVRIILALEARLGYDEGGVR